LFTGAGNAGPAENGRAGSGLEKKNQKIIFGKFVISPHIFYCILINIGLYFYIVKMQI
jgi:hypothetical protein